VTDETLRQSFKALAALQSLDTELHQLTHRRSNLPEAAELQALQRRQGELEAVRRDLDETNSGLMARQEDLATSIARQVQRHHELERQLQASTGAASRDLAAMDAELHRLAEHQRNLEDEELLLLEEAEPLDEALHEVMTSLSEVAVAMDEVRDRGRKAVADIDASRVEKEIERAGLVAAVPADLLQTYDRVRAKVGVVAVARLQGHRCDGCNLELPAVEVDHLSKLPAHELAMCDHCGRILLRAEQLR
jgi:predicted  nucleic acid-binding Zn-ribbon protein